jgi:C1A family cysteine protease
MDPQHPKRVYGLRATPRMYSSAAPLRVDLRESGRMPPVYDQGALGSCTANALCAAQQYIDVDATQGSRLFVYYNEREMEGATSTDSGALLSDGISAFVKFGVCPEPQWPYVISRFATKPTQACYNAALENVVTRTTRLHASEPAMKACLAAGVPFVVGFQVFESFESAAVASTGDVQMPKKGEKCLGGHAVLCVGYDDARRVWIMRNSWGGDWGDSGYFYMPYEYLLDPSLSGDLWSIDAVALPPLPAPPAPPVPPPEPSPQPPPNPTPPAPPAPDVTTSFCRSLFGC